MASWQKAGRRPRLPVDRRTQVLSTAINAEGITDFADQVFRTSFDVAMIAWTAIGGD
jgi:hypothetical protein